MMLSKFFLYGILFFFVFVSSNCTLEIDESTRIYTLLTDDNWDQIQSGEWLIGIYHDDWKESFPLVNDWNTLALKCKQLGIQAALVNAKGNPGLQVRFLVKGFPKVFYIKDGIVRMFQVAERNELVRIIKDQKWEELDLISSYLSPLSWHVSLFSTLCAQSLKLYNTEKTFITHYIDSLIVVNTAFCFTFVAFGTIVGLTFSCFFQILKFIMHCCLKTPNEEIFIERPLTSLENKSKPTQVIPSKVLKHSKKQNVGKLRKRRN